MTTTEAAIVQFMMATPAISALVGDRIYPLRLPQDPTYPAIVYERVSTPREHSQDGASKLTHPRIEVSVYGSTHSAVLEVAEAVRARLDGFAGIMGTAPNELDVHAVFVEDQSDGYDEGFGIYWQTFDVILWHNE